LGIFQPTIGVSTPSATILIAFVMGFGLPLKNFFTYQASVRAHFTPDRRCTGP